MAEINNSLAAQIQVPQTDVGGTLAKIGQINLLNTENALKQQELKYKQGVLDRNDQYYPTDVETLARAKQQHLENAGRIGSAYLANPSDASWSASVQAAKESGLIRSTLEEAQYLALPPAQRANVARSLLQAGQPSQAAIEQSGVPAGNRAREEGRYVPQGIEPNKPYISRTEAATGNRAPVSSSPAIMGDDEAVRKGIYSPTPEQIKRGVTGPANPLPKPGIVKNSDGSISSNVTPETTETQKSLGEDYSGYKESAKNAAMTKYLLRNMQDDADRLSTGKGATFTNTAKQWLQAAQSLPGVGETVKRITGDISDPIAAFEALQKNAGQLTRATLKDVEGKAAAEYRMIQSQLPNAEMSPRGLKLVAAQMTAPEDFKQAKLQAADHWKAANNGSLAGFESDWNKNISPTTFLFARLPGQERDALIKNLGKTDQGKAMLGKIKNQSQWAHDHGLDEFID